jgi:glyoxylase-like metal-dependent hydrolase (beta-lactamase superfamily II)
VGAASCGAASYHPDVHVGRLEILPVFDGTARLAPGEAYIGTPPEAWMPHRRFLDEDGVLELTLGGFLIRGRGRVVLVDTGIGIVNAGPFKGGLFLESLAAHGVQPEEVSDVVLTHLHFDHVGWTSQNGAAIFDRATYHCDQRDWDHFVTDANPQPPRASFVGSEGGVAKLLPVADRLKPWSSSGPILAGLDAMVAPGHTPGSTIMVVSDGAERALLLGDVVHCPVELLDDEWEGLADVDPEQAKRTRVALAREIEGSNVPVVAGHFPGLEFGRLIAARGKRHWVV